MSKSSIRQEVSRQKSSALEQSRREGLKDVLDGDRVSLLDQHIVCGVQMPSTPLGCPLVRGKVGVEIIRAELVGESRRVIDGPPVIVGVEREGIEGSAVLRRQGSDAVHDTLFQRWVFHTHTVKYS